MTIEDQIQALLAEAEPLRCLPEDEPMKARLTLLVDQINLLRAEQTTPRPVIARVEGEEAPAMEPVRRGPGRRGPGRPRKTPEAI